MSWSSYNDWDDRPQQPGSKRGMHSDGAPDDRWHSARIAASSRSRCSSAPVPLIKSPRQDCGDSMDVYLIDGTYELFRHYYALPSAKTKDGREVAAVRGVVGSVLSLLNGVATHLAVATD